MQSFMNKDFLFVNRSAVAFSHTPDERKHISSHAQKNYRRKLRAQQVEAHQSQSAALASLRSRFNGPGRLPDATTRSTSDFNADEINVRRDGRRQECIPAVSPHTSINEYALSALPLDRGSFDILQYFLSVSVSSIMSFSTELIISPVYSSLFHLEAAKALSVPLASSHEYKQNMLDKGYRATIGMRSQHLSNEKYVAASPSGKLNCHTSLQFSVLGQIIQGALNSPIHMYALLTMTAGGMRNFTGVTVDSKHVPEYLMNKALPHLRKEVARIANGELLNDKQVLLDMWYVLGLLLSFSPSNLLSYLFAHEWYAENYTTALIHLRVVHSLLHTLDQTVPFELNIFQDAVFDDVMVCLETGTRPIRELDWSPSNLSVADQTEIRAKLENLRQSDAFNKPSFSSLDARFVRASFPLNQEATSTIVLTPQAGVGLIRAVRVTGNGLMLILLRDILFVIEVMQLTLISTAEALKFTDWATKKVCALLHTLLSMHLIGEWECVRLDLIIMLSIVSSNRAWRSASMNASRLRAALTGKPDHLIFPAVALQNNTADEISVTFTDQRMLLWVLIVGSANAECLDQGWFLERALSTARGLGLKTGTELRELLAEYICLLRKQETIVRRLSTLLEAG